MIRLLAIVVAIWPAISDAACRQALVLALDVSGSVDAQEYRLQRDGVATALGSDAVRALILAPGAAPMKLAVFEWSGPDDQAMVLQWTEISDEATLLAAITTIRAHRRQPHSPTTALGSAMQRGAALLAQHPSCWKHTLDISGDGQANTGPRPQFVDLSHAPAGMIINGLVIGEGDGHGADHRAANIRALSSYFTVYVIRGAGAFVETAIGFETYAQAMERKLIRELQAIAIGAVIAP